MTLIALIIAAVILAGAIFFGMVLTGGVLLVMFYVVQRTRRTWSR